MKIKEVEFKDNPIQPAFLEGVIMPNGEFVANGRCVFLKEGDKVYIFEKE